jgi:hypothetical protein
MTVFAVLDAAGRRRSPATMPGYHAGRAPRNRGSSIPPTRRAYKQRGIRRGSLGEPGGRRARLTFETPLRARVRARTN